MISFVIPHYNGWPLLKKSLNSILTAQKEAGLKTLEIIVVNNNSTDDSLSLLKKTFPQIKVISNSQNHGFAKAVNQGAKQARGNWLAICNNDLVLHPSWLKAMLGFLRSPPPQLIPNLACLFGSVLNHSGTKIESQGLKYFLSGKAKNINNGKAYLPPQPKTHNQTTIHNPKPKPIWGASASLVLYRRDIFLKMGGFDENFFAYEEDVDLALRLHLAGFKTYLIPFAISYHLGGATSSLMGNLRPRMDAKNWFFIILKNYSLKTLFKNSPAITLERLRNLSGLIKLTIKVDRLAALWQLPLSLFNTYGTLFLKTPSLIKKRTLNPKLL